MSSQARVMTCILAAALFDCWGGAGPETSNLLRLDGPAELATSEPGTWTCDATALLRPGVPTTFRFAFDNEALDPRLRTVRVDPPSGSLVASATIPAPASLRPITATCTVQQSGEDAVASEPFVTVLGILRSTRRLALTLPAGAHVTSAPPGIDCPGTCAASFPWESSVELVAEVPAGRTVRLWSTTDASMGPAPCEVVQGRARLTYDQSCRLEYGLTKTPGPTRLRERWSIQSGHRWRVRWASRAGLLVALENGTGTLRRWVNGTPLPPATLAPLARLEVAPDGRLLALIDGRGAVQLSRPLEAGLPRVTVPGTAPTSFGFSDDGRVALVQGSDVVEYDTQSLAELRRWSLAGSEAASASTFVPGLTGLLVLRRSGVTRIDTAGTTVLVPGSFEALAVDATGTHLVVLAAFVGPRVHRVADGVLLASATYDGSASPRVVFSGDGESIYMMREPHEFARVWAWRGSSPAPLPGEEWGVRSLDVDLVTGRLALGGTAVRLLEADGSSTTLLHPPRPGAILVNADGTRAYAQAPRGIDELDTADGSVLRTLFTDEPLRTFDLALDGRTFALATAEGLAVRRDDDQTRHVHPIGGEAARVEVRGDPPRAFVQITGTVKVVDLTSGTIEPLGVSTYPRGGVAPSGARLFTGSAILDTRTGATFPLPQAQRIDLADDVAWSADDRLLLGVHANFRPSTAVHDTRTRDLVGVWAIDGAGACALLPDAHLALIGGYGQVQLVDLSDGTALAKVPVKVSFVDRISLDRAGTKVLVSGEYGEVALLELEL